MKFFCLIFSSLIISLISASSSSSAGTKTCRDPTALSPSQMTLLIEPVVMSKGGGPKPAERPEPMVVNPKLTKPHSMDAKEKMEVAEPEITKSNSSPMVGQWRSNPTQGEDTLLTPSVVSDIQYAKHAGFGSKKTP